MVAEGRDLEPVELGRLEERPALFGLDLQTVENEFDHISRPMAFLAVLGLELAPQAAAGLPDGRVLGEAELDLLVPRLPFRKR
jgi:hypothetical protein